MKDMEMGGNERYGDGVVNKRGGEGGMKGVKKGKSEG